MVRDLLLAPGMAEFPMGASGHARRILEYLAAHRNSQDTVEGIAEWWMLDRDLVRTLGETRQALAELVELGLVEAVGHGQSVRYRLKPDARPG